MIDPPLNASIDVCDKNIELDVHFNSNPTRCAESPRNLRISRRELNSQCGKQFNYEITRPLAIGYGKLKNVIVSDLWFPCGRQILREAKLHSPTEHGEIKDD